MELVDVYSTILGIEKQGSEVTDYIIWKRKLGFTIVWTVSVFFGLIFV
jgi:hypothetical protein